MAVVPDELAIYSDFDGTQATGYLGTYTVAVGFSGDSISNIMSSLSLSIPQGADGFTVTNLGSVVGEYGLNETIPGSIFYASGSTYVGYFTYPPQTETITGFYLDGTEYSLGGGVTSVNGNTGAVTVNEVPSGGTDGQVLSKVSGSVAWANPSGGGKFVDIFMVGGGGAGGTGLCCNSYEHWVGGSGGGGGGYVECHKLPVTATSTSIGVGTGGTANSGSQCSGGNGGDSYFGNIKAYGGGGGGGGRGVNELYCLCCAELSGGNLGGGAWGSANIKQQGGHQGGVFYMYMCNYNCWNYGVRRLGQRNGGGGAGGDGCTGYDVYGCCGGDGGAGIYSNFNGTRKCYAGGGGGAAGRDGSGSYGKGRGGGGNGGNYCYQQCAGCPGECCGGGGGGGYANQNCFGPGGAGAKGIVYVRYPSDGSYGITNATGGTKSSVTVDGTTYCLHTFTSGGTFTIVS